MSVVRQSQLPSPCLRPKTRLRLCETNSLPSTARWTYSSLKTKVYQNVLWGWPGLRDEGQLTTRERKVRAPKPKQRAMVAASANSTHGIGSVGMVWPWTGGTMA